MPAAAHGVPLPLAPPCARAQIFKTKVNAVATQSAPCGTQMLRRGPSRGARRAATSPLAARSRGSSSRSPDMQPTGGAAGAAPEQGPSARRASAGVGQSVPRFRRDAKSRRCRLCSQCAQCHTAEKGSAHMQVRSRGGEEARGGATRQPARRGRTTTPAHRPIAGTSSAVQLQRWRHQQRVPSSRWRRGGGAAALATSPVRAQMTHRFQELLVTQSADARWALQRHRLRRAPTWAACLGA